MVFWVKKVPELLLEAELNCCNFSVSDAFCASLRTPLLAATIQEPVCAFLFPFNRCGPLLPTGCLLVFLIFFPEQVA